MINEDSIQAVNASRLNEHFGKPLYDSYCFSQIPTTIYHLLSGKGAPGLPASVLGDLPQRYDKVILLWLDAFGWRFVEQFRDQYPFLKRFAEQGVLSKLTTQFPSTTAAHTTTMHSTYPVGESGVFEWFYYEPLLDRVIAPLLFSFAGDKERNTLRKAEVDPVTLYPKRTIYKRLRQRNVRSYIFQHLDYTPSPYSDVMFAGARTSSYKTHSEALINLTDAVLAERQKAYFFMYIDTIDTLGHRYGPESRQFAAEVDTVMTVLEKLLYNSLAGKLKDTLLLVTADHGQISVSPESTIYLNRLEPSLAPLIRTTRQGELIVPGGSPRDMFLYIKEECLDEAHAQLSAQLEGRAEVYRVQALIDQGFFGPVISEEFKGRVGNLVILPYPHETVWWYEKNRFELRFHGSHGGLSREEMETVLMALPL